MGINYIIGYNDRILVTGAPGFIGTKVVETLINTGFSNLLCFVRPSSNLDRLNRVINKFRNTKIQIMKGNLLSREDCQRATQGVQVIFHLAAGVEKSFPGCYMNSVVGTRNLLDSILKNKDFARFLNVSSIAVYSGNGLNSGNTLNETAEVEKYPENRHEAYAYGKIKQDELVLEYNKRYNVPYVIVRPGDVYGPGKRKISGKVGIDTFGVFLHLGGSNIVPFTFLDNCAEAIVLGGVKKGVDGEIFNIIDDDLPTSREFLKMYKKRVGYFKSVYLPYRLFYFLCHLWEKYEIWSKGQLPPAFNRKKCIAHWKGLQYSNRKTKQMLGWKPTVPTVEGLEGYFEFMKEN